MLTKICTSCDGKQFHILLGGTRAKCDGCLGKGWVYDDAIEETKIIKKKRRPRINIDHIHKMEF